MSELKIENIVIREASLGDAKILFQLSNDESVRENSINRNKIVWEKHINWLKDKINSDNYYIYLFFDNDKFIGQVKFEIKDETAVISISIVNEYRGKKLASPMLRKGIDNILNTKKRVNKIIAYIKLENQASVKSFKRVGFNFHDQVEIDNEKFNRYLLIRENYEWIEYPQK